MNLMPKEKSPTTKSAWPLLKTALTPHRFRKLWNFLFPSSTTLSKAFLLPLLLLALGACTSFEHQNKLAGFDDALSALKAGKIEKAKKRLEPLCQKKHKASCALLGKKVEVLHRLPIMQGVTTINASQFVVAQEGKAPLRFLIREKGQMKISEPNILKEVHRYKTNRRLWHIAFEDLKAGATYKLFVTNEMGELLDARRFRLFRRSFRLFRHF